MSRDNQPIGAHLADKVACFLGSWFFILLQSAFLALWIVLNIIALIRHWDSYPFIFLNLLLSVQASFTGPLVLLSQNKQAEQDRQRVEQDLQMNIKSEAEVRQVMQHLSNQDEKLTQILETLQYTSVKVPEIDAMRRDEA